MASPGRLESVRLDEGMVHRGGGSGGINPRGESHRWLKKYSAAAEWSGGGVNKARDLRSE